jgi:hypothetical protein
MDFGDMGWGDVGWINLGRIRDQWRALVNTVMNLRLSQNGRNFLNIIETWSFSK